MRITTSLAILSVLISTPLAARADEGCESWFCEDAKPADPPKPEDPPAIDPESVSKLKGADVGVELQDGSLVRGVIVEVALDHVTVAVGPNTVTIAWAQVVAIRVIPTTENQPKKPEAPTSTSEGPAKKKQEPVSFDEGPTTPAKAPTVFDEPLEPAPEPAFAPGLFAIGARLKLVGAVDGSRFSKSSAAVSDYVSGGVAYEVSFAMRLTQSLLLRSWYEHADMFRGVRNYTVTSSPTSESVGIGVRWLFGDAPDVRGIFEAGIGYRWLSVPYANGAPPDGTPRRPGAGLAMFEGGESLRVALGTAFVADEHSRFELLVEGSLGRFTSVHDDHTQLRTRELADSATAPHGFLGIAIGLELGP